MYLCLCNEYGTDPDCINTRGQPCDASCKHDICVTNSFPSDSDAICL